MRVTRLLMGMPITVEIVDHSATHRDVEEVFEYFTYVDNTFSTYKADSEISLFNQGVIRPNELSDDMKEVFRLAEDTKQETDGYFDIFHDEKFDPSGLVKGWAIQKASDLLASKGFSRFYVDAGGDVQVAGINQEGNSWRVGIKNPFKQEEIVKVVSLQDAAIATSGNYIRGEHIYNPKSEHIQEDIVSMTVIGKKIYDADRYATAAFAMGKRGIEFIYTKIGYEGYMIDKSGRATYTPGFERYVIKT